VSRRSWDGGTVHWVFTVCVLLIATGAPLPWLQEQLSGSPAGEAEGGSANMALWVMIYTIAVVLGHQRAGLLVRLALKHWYMLALVGLAAFSTMWSEDPSVTARRTVALLGTCVVGWFLGIRYSPRELAQAVATALLIAGVLSAAAGGASEAGRVSESVDLGAYEDAYTGAWRGIYPARNLFAQVMALGALSCWLVAGSMRHGRMWYAGGAVLCGALVLAARSMTALLLLGVLAVTVHVMEAVRRRPRTSGVILSTGLVVLTAGGWIVLGDPQRALMMVGRDVTLTGRAPLWSAVGEAIAARPLLGWGHGAFWLGWAGAGSGPLLRSVGWTPGYAHNGFLDQALGLGALGVLFLLVALAVAFRSAVFWALSRPSLVCLWPATVVAFLALANLSEGGLFRQNGYQLLLLVAVSSSILARTDPGRKESTSRGIPAEGGGGIRSGGTRRSGYMARRERLQCRRRPRPLSGG
jgi:O-antigen ligase